MTTELKSEFQLSAVPGEELARRLAYLASQDNGSVLTGGFAKDGIGLDRDSNGNPQRQAASAMEFLAQQEQQQRMAAMASRIDALEQAAREALINAENEYAAILSNANRATDGRAVFKDEDGNIRDEDGQIVDEAEVDMSEWDNGAPSWERKELAVERVEDANTTYDRVTAARDKLESGAMSETDLSALANDLDGIESDLATLEEPSPASETHDRIVESPAADMADSNHTGGGIFDMKPL